MQIVCKKASFAAESWSAAIVDTRIGFCVKCS